MEANPYLGIVIPVYNEEQHIASLLEDWQKVFGGTSVSYHFIIVDDGSTDKSLDILQAISARPEISIHSKANAGHGSAILAGYRLAAGCEWIFQLDSDHQLDPLAFSVLWENRDRYDLLLGERTEKKATLSRRMVSFISQLSVRLLYGKGVKDVNCPYRLIRASGLNAAIPHIPENSFAPNILLTAWFIFSKARIFRTEVNLRQEGNARKSKMNVYFLKGSIRALFQTIQFRFRL